MLILDNIIFELQNVGGVSKYWAETIMRMDGVKRRLRYLEGLEAKNNLFRKQLSLSGPIIRDKGNITIRRLRKLQIEADIFHSSYYRISKKARANVVTIHDFMNELFPSSYNDLILANLKRSACRNADAIVVVSEKTRQDLLDHYSFVDPERVTVTYNGVDKAFYPERRSAAIQINKKELHPGQYFLYVGTRGKCKNFPLVLQILAEARDRGKDFPLVVVGGNTFSRQEKEIVKSLNIPLNCIHMASDVSTHKLRLLYSNCTALLIPSRYEGFGLPAAEAARCGALVISAKGSSLDEIVGETDYAIDLSRDGEINRIISLGFESEYSLEERRRMQERSKMFDWNHSVAKLNQVYDDVI